MNDLQTQWLADCHDLGVAAPDPHVFRALASRYGEPQRHYHTLQHIDECLAKLAEVRHLSTHPAEVAMALWFHDAIYDPTRHDNEEKSADWASACLRQAGVSDNVTRRIDALILATRHHAAPTDMDAKILVDVDLTILAAPRERFAEYERQIRAEYVHIPDLPFNTKRRNILQGFLDRAAIFTTPLFFERYEVQARRNITASLTPGR
ncbi:MAG: hypothetical protein JSS58_05375 [Proteobacteria bacterium]|nr:hypothetical protein [Pseudomonadota bacterium]